MRIKNVLSARILICRWLALAALAVVPLAGHAQSTATGTQYFGRSMVTGNEYTTPFNSAQGACTYTAQTYTSQYGGSVTGALSGLSCTASGTSSGGATLTPYTYTIRTATGSIALGCPSAGESKKVNFTLGFTEDPSGSKNGAVATHADKFAALLAAGTSCISGGGSACSVTIGNSPANLGDAWISANPNAQGLYRVSQDYAVTYTGGACTPSTDQKMLTESTDAAAACAGTFGTVNGKGVCVPTNAANRNVVQSPVGAPIRRVGNPTAGSSASLPLAQRQPATGGTGNNDGGPSSAVDGMQAPVGSALPTTASSSSGSGTVDLSGIKTDCDKYPNSVGCSQYGTPDNGVTLSHQDSGFSSIGVVSFSDSQSCPAPLSFAVRGSAYTLSFQSVCDNAQTYVRPVVLVLAAAMAAFVFVGGFKV